MNDRCEWISEIKRKIRVDQVKFDYIDQNFALNSPNGAIW